MGVLQAMKVGLLLSVNVGRSDSTLIPLEHTGNHTYRPPTDSETLHFDHTVLFLLQKILITNSDNVTNSINRSNFIMRADCVFCEA